LEYRVDGKQTKSSAPLQVILMFVIIIATIALGFFMVPGTEEERAKLLGELGTTNHGTLLSPMVDIETLEIQDQSGNPWVWRDHKPKWRFLVVGGANCSEDCANMLYLTRQVHIRLGKYSHRLERLYVNTDASIAPALAEDFEANHPYLKVVHAEGDDLAQWLANTNSRYLEGTAEAILVDPAGRAMMVYDARHNGIDMLEDINHLLKYSHE
jgi:cytochrome oxidase Cu insertion factor (SCO1/SenC/PrrC family)